MNSLFNLDNPLFQFLGRLVDVMLLNILCLVCCIPIVTIGPSVTALYYCMLKISRDSDSSISGMFFNSFRENFKQGTVMTIIFLLCGLFLIVDILACNLFALPILKYIRILLYVLCIIFIILVSFAFPLLAQFENSTKNILKNSLIMAVSHMFHTIMIVFLNVLPLLILYFMTELFLLLLPFWMLFGIALVALINSKLFVNIFDYYIS